MHLIRRGVVVVGDSLPARCFLALLREQRVGTPYYWFPTPVHPSGWGPLASPLTVHDHSQESSNWTTAVIRRWLKHCNVPHAVTLHVIGTREDTPPELQDLHLTGLALCHDSSLSRPFACRRTNATGVLFHPRLLEEALGRQIRFDSGCELVEAGSPVVRYRDELIVGSLGFRLSAKALVVDFSQPARAVHWPYQLTTVNLPPVYQLENYHRNCIVSYSHRAGWWARGLSRVNRARMERQLDDWPGRLVMLVPPGPQTPPMAIGHSFGYAVHRVHCGTVVLVRNRLTGRLAGWANGHLTGWRSLSRDKHPAGWQYWYVGDASLPSLPSAIMTAQWLVNQLEG